MGDGKKTLTTSTTNSDEEMFKDLDVLLNLEELEESEFWDEMMNLGELETEQSESAKSNFQKGNN